MLKFILWPFTAKQDGDVNGNERYATDNTLSPRGFLA